MNADSLTAVVLNWRTADLTRRSVEALVADGVAEGRIVVVDNASGDGSAERLRSALPGVRVLELETNVGFARGNNRGAAELPGDAYLFVNSDAFVRRPGSVGRLLAALGDPGVGIAVPRLLNEDGTLQPSVVPISTPLPELIRASGLSRLVPNRLQPRLGTHWDHSRTRAIGAAIGAVLLVRGSTWDELAGSTSNGSCTPRTTTCSAAPPRTAGRRSSSPRPSSFTSAGRLRISAGAIRAAPSASLAPRRRWSGTTSAHFAPG